MFANVLAVSVSKQRPDSVPRRRTAGVLGLLRPRHGPVELPSRSTAYRSPAIVEGRARVPGLLPGRSSQFRSPGLHREPQGDLVPGPGARAKCVLSHEGAVVVYVVARPFEAASSVGTSKKPQLTMTYTTGQPVASFERLEGWEECRPCTETELRESYCFSDLEAMVRNTTLDPDHRSINWWLSVSQTHRGRMPEYVTRPTRCGFPRDTQEARLILARWHLGRASVTCAPKLSQWERLVRRGKPQCKYEGETAGTDNT
ncbi:hypothetical protein HPB48_014066 [Haemaphysalis longicornis]|uniref:Uncharacterized protein n=1 Tax=Haemaphysalis longicornis TaxID=44386 RepID=A0A9J6FQL4_HAELO|nr:hypothetical protein HPB48_014066 [Haemaphysalis longicornis]